MLKYAITILILASNTQFCAASLQDVQNSTLLIRVEYKDHKGDTYSAYGNGFVYKVDENYYYVLTAGHLMDKPIVERVFARDNRRRVVDPSRWVSGRLAWKIYNKTRYSDVALLMFPKTNKLRDMQPVPLFKGRIPYLMPLMNQSFFKNSAVPEVTRGKMLHRLNKNAFKTSMKFRPGKSGGPITGPKGKTVYGMITLQNGTAMRSDAIVRILKQKTPHAKSTH